MDLSSMRTIAGGADPVARAGVITVPNGLDTPPANSPMEPGMVAEGIDPRPRKQPTASSSDELGMGMDDRCGCIRGPASMDMGLPRNLVARA